MKPGINVALGTESMGGPFHAPIDWFMGKGLTEDQLKYGAEAHNALSERAAAHGVCLRLEHLNRSVAWIGEDIGVFHVSANARGIPGRGHIDFAAMFRTLKAAGYHGWLTLGAYGAGLPAIAATRDWRPWFPDLDTLLAEGASFIRRTWAVA